MGGLRSGIRLCLLAWALSSAPPVAAQELSLLPVAGTPARASDAERLIARLRERLVRAGWTVRPLGEAQLDRASALLACDTSPCASAGLDALATDAIGAPALWERHDGTRELTLGVQGRSGRLLELTVPVVDLRSAAAAELLAEQLLARWPELSTVSEGPRRVDDAPGLAPDAPPFGEIAEVRSGWNVAIGTALVAGSIVPIALGAKALIHDGECVGPRPDGGCPVDPQRGTYEVYSFGACSGALLGAGVALAGAGLYFLAAGPIRVGADASRQHAIARVRVEL